MKNKTIAERLREYDGDDMHCGADFFAFALNGEEARCLVRKCDACRKALASELADAIEAEQAERHHDVDADVDVDTLLKVANSIEYEAQRKTGVSIIPATQLSLWVGYIRDAVKGATFEQAKPQLPDGIQWPRFEDGELVKFGDEVNGCPASHFLFGDLGCTVRGNNGSVELVTVEFGEPVKRPEPEVLDADTQEALRADMELGAWDYLKKHGVVLVRKDGETKKEHRTRVRLAHREHLCERQRKLMGGE
jgi:hypothetical protein